jgi:hypothetical protein
MNQGSDIEHRRAPRKHVNASVPVLDVMSGQVMGHMGNLSATGMMLIGVRAPAPDAVYQVSLALPDERGLPRAVQLGIQEQWHEPAAAQGQYWSGYRIVAAGDADTHAMQAWLGPDVQG